MADLLKYNIILAAVHVLLHRKYTCILLWSEHLCPLPQFVCWNTDSNAAVSKYGDSMGWLGHEGRVLMSGMRTLINVTEGTALWRRQRASPDTKLNQLWTLWSLNIKNMLINYHFMIFHDIVLNLLQHMITQPFFVVMEVTGRKPCHSKEKQMYLVSMLIREDFPDGTSLRLVDEVITNSEQRRRLCRATDLGDYAKDRLRSPLHLRL